MHDSVHVSGSLHASLCKASGCQSEQLTVSLRLSSGLFRMHNVHGEGVSSSQCFKKRRRPGMPDACPVQMLPRCT